MNTEKGFKTLYDDLNITFIVFLILKAAGLVDWSWYTIISPFLIRIIILVIEGFLSEFNK